MRIRQGDEPITNLFGRTDPDRTGVHLGVHTPRTLRHSSDSSDTGKGNELAKSFVRCLSPVVLNSLGPLALLGSTPSPGTMNPRRCESTVNRGSAVCQSHIWRAPARHVSICPHRGRPAAFPWFADNSKSPR